MGSATVEAEFQSERCRGEAAFTHHDLAFFEAWQIVQSIGHIGLDLLELRVVEYGLCALSGFLGGLEEQHYLALVGTLLTEPLRQSTENGGVTVVPAFV